MDKEFNALFRLKDDLVNMGYTVCPTNVDNTDPILSRIDGIKTILVVCKTHAYAECVMIKLRKRILEIGIERRNDLYAITLKGGVLLKIRSIRSEFQDHRGLSRNTTLIWIVY